MKKILFSTLIAASALSASAQTFVSTTAENKNVLLEEFTGTNCTFCPDGHRIANEIVANNSGDAFAINIHTGGFAGSNPDFTTADGDAIAGNFTISGYPAGTVNRGPATGRGDWTADATTILGQSSPVNVAAEATLDFATGALTINVEAYYTGAGTGTSNKLHVALLQNNVEGPQTGGNYNPTAVLANGNYMHQHMLRDMITPLAGDDITTIAAGDFYSNTYTYNVPADINGIPTDLGNLEVVVFVSETSYADVITANKASMNVILGGGQVAITPALSSTMAPATGLCTADVTPEVVITNDGTTAIDSVDVSYTNGPTVLVTGLAAGASQTVTFPAVTLTPFTPTTFTFNANSDNYYTQVLLAGNVSFDSPTYNRIGTSAAAATFSEGFESFSFGDNVFTNMLNIGPGIVALLNSGNLGGFGNSANSFTFDFWSENVGTEFDLVLDKMDFSNTANAYTLSFDRAYAQYDATTNDKVEVLVSTDCGATWTSVFDKAGADLATAPASTSRFLPTTAAEWTRDTINLTSYAGNGEVVVKFKGTSAYGNMFFVDNINVDNAPVSSVATNANTAFEVFPNPVVNAINLDINLDNTTSFDIQVTDVLGQTVFTQNVSDVSEFNGSIDATGFAAGVYTLTVNFADNSVLTKKIVKK